VQLFKFSGSGEKQTDEISLTENFYLIGCILRLILFLGCENKFKIQDRTLLPPLSKNPRIGPVFTHPIFANRPFQVMTPWKNIRCSSLAGQRSLHEPQQKLTLG